MSTALTYHDIVAGKFSVAPPELHCCCDACCGLAALLDGGVTMPPPSPPPPEVSFSTTLPWTWSGVSSAELQASPFDGFALNSYPELSAKCAMPPAALEAVGKREEKRWLSVQSAAARRRRKKIGERSRDLGELIPGGKKMTTAEMFQAAFKYVKFMQAQVALLQLMASSEETESRGNIEELHVLLCCPQIQEKLYMGGNCVVPEEFVGTLVGVEQLQSDPSISKDLDCLLQSFR